MSDLDPIIREKELPPDDHRWEANKKQASDARAEVGTGDKLCTDDIAQPIISGGFTSCRPFIIVNVDTQNTIFLHCNNELTIGQAALLYFFLQEAGNKQGVYLKKGSLPGYSMPTFVQYLKERVEMKSIGFRNFCDVIFLPKEGCILRRFHRSNTILEDRPFDSSYYSALEKGHVKSKESIEKQAEEFVANWERGEQLNKALYPLVKNKKVGEIKNLLRDSGKNISQIIKPNIYDLLNYEERKSFSSYSSHNLHFSRLIRLVTLDLDGGGVDKRCLTKEGLQKSLKCFKLLDDLLLQAGNIDESHSFL